MDLDVFCTPPKRTINGLGYWTVGWNFKHDGKSYGKYSWQNPPRKNEIAKILANEKAKELAYYNQLVYTRDN